MRLLLLLLLLPLLSCERKEPAESSDSEFIATPNSEWSSTPAFWVWGRGTGFKEEDLKALESLSEILLYWQVAEIDLGSEADNRPFWLANYSDIQGSVIPTIRISPNVQNLTDPYTFEAIEGTGNFRLPSLNPGETPSGPRRLQIDYDCPASLLTQYADLLRKIRKSLFLTELSITALASWIDAPGFETLAGAVDEMVPMFYDLEADQAEAVAMGNPLPMVDESSLRWIRKWQACSTPWRAGLPNFQRLTQFEADGTLIGHHRSWSTEGLLTHPAIEKLESPQESISCFEVTADGSVSSISIRAGQRLYHRMPDEAVTRQAIQAAKDSGALGIVWFAHPSSAPRAWHSVQHLAALQHGELPEPSIVFKVTDRGAIRLTNTGPADLTQPTSHQSWQLVITAPAGTFGRGLPEGFLTCEVVGGSMNHPELASKLILTFPSLPSGGSLRSSSGLIADPNSDLIKWTLEAHP